MSNILQDLLSGSVSEQAQAAPTKKSSVRITNIIDECGVVYWYDFDESGVDERAVDGHIYIGCSRPDDTIEVETHDCIDGKEMAYRRSEVVRRTRLAKLAGWLEIVDYGTGGETLRQGEEAYRGEDQQGRTDLEG